MQTLRKMHISLIIQNWHSSEILSLNRIHKVIIKQVLISSFLPVALGESILVHRMREGLGGLFFYIYMFFLRIYFKNNTLFFSHYFKTKTMQSYLDDRQIL